MNKLNHAVATRSGRGFITKPAEIKRRWTNVRGTYKAEGKSVGHQSHLISILQLACSSLAISIQLTIHGQEKTLSEA
jgi:hypothetical protein